MWSPIAAVALQAMRVWIIVGCAPAPAPAAGVASVEKWVGVCAAGQGRRVGRRGVTHRRPGGGLEKGGATGVRAGTHVDQRMHRVQITARARGHRTATWGLT